MKTLTPEQSRRLPELERMESLHQAAWEKHASFGRSGWSHASEEQQAKINSEIGFVYTNELRAELEELRFISQPPRKYFAYPSDDGKRVIGFMGNTLAWIYDSGNTFKSNMGDSRRSFHATGIDGIRYVGTIFGTYLRMRPAKHQPDSI